MTDEKPKLDMTALAAAAREAIEHGAYVGARGATPEEKAGYAAAAASFKASDEAKTGEAGFAAREAIRRAQSGNKGQSK
jgi:hypothetical protein